MAKSHHWGIRSRRDLLTWDSEENHMRPGSSRLDRPIHSPSAIDLVYRGHCAWCGQSDIGIDAVRGHVEGKGKVFCSDVCFAQCRRAAFKRAKVCDWCKHVRHTSIYVDLHDGQRQLQFCTEKCRNQYKMHLFCTETTSLGIQSCIGTASARAESGHTPPAIDPTKNPQQPSSEILITPELWLLDSRTEHEGDSSRNGPKKECSFGAAVASVESDGPEEQACEAPLNLVHSSRRIDNGHSPPSVLPVKRKPIQSGPTQTNDVPSSKKGKCHRVKSQSVAASSHQSYAAATHLPSSTPSPHLEPPTGAAVWPAPFPYSSHLANQYIFQSHLLALNHSLCSLGKQRGPPISPVQHCVDEVVDSSKSPPNSATSEASNATETPSEPTSLDDKSKLNNTIRRPVEQADQLGSNFLMMDGDKSSALSMTTPNFAIVRVPILVPLPIPVPIPIPLNIHEKYLKHVLSS